MTEEEELICKLIKCSYLLAGQSESIVSAQAAVPAVFNTRKVLELISLLEEASHGLEEAGF